MMNLRALALVVAAMAIIGCSAEPTNPQAAQEQPAVPVEQTTQEPVPTQTPIPSETPRPTVTPEPSATPLPPTATPPRPTVTPRSQLQGVLEAIRPRAEEVGAEEKRLTDRINRNAILYRVGQISADEVCVGWQEQATLYLEYHTFLTEIVAEHVDSFSSSELSLMVTMQSETESVLVDWFSENAEVLELCGMGWTPQLGQRRGQVKRDSRWKV